MALRTFQRVQVKPGLTLAEVPALIERLQDAIEEAMAGAATNPTANADSMDVDLVIGDQTKRHKLGRVPRVFPSDPRVTLVSATESALVLNSSADLSCTLLLL